MADKTLAQKMFIKPGVVLGLVHPPEGYLARLGLPDGVQVVEPPDSPVDVIQVFVADRQELERELQRLKPLLKPGGVLWVTYHKGGSGVKTDINRDSIFAYGKSIGLQAVAQVAVDEDWSALRLKRVE